MSKQVNWYDHVINVLSVIVGVSLAFWVNDSSERGKRKAELNFTIDSFIDELHSDSMTYSGYQIPDNRRQVADIQAVISYLAAGELDSLSLKFESAVGLNNYHPTSTTFNSLSSAGKLDLITDFNLQQEINEYHTVTAKEAEWRGKFQVDYCTNELIPWMIRNVDLVNPEFDRINKVEFTNLLLVYAGIIENKVKQYEAVSVEAGQLKQKLEQLKNGQ